MSNEKIVMGGPTSPTPGSSKGKLIWVVIILLIVVAGIMYMVSGKDETHEAKVKERDTASVETTKTIEIPAMAEKPVEKEQKEPMAVKDASVAPEPETAKKVTERPTIVAANTYVVKDGDCLWNIAAKSEVYGNSFRWSDIYEANKDQIKDPNLIHPNQSLKIP